MFVIKEEKSVQRKWTLKEKGLLIEKSSKWGDRAQNKEHNIERQKYISNRETLI